MDPILERYQALEEHVKAYSPNVDTQKQIGRAHV